MLFEHRDVISWLLAGLRNQPLPRRGTSASYHGGGNLGFFKTLIGGTIGFALGGRVGLIAGSIIANDTSGRGGCDGSDVGDSGSGLGDTMDE